MFNSIKKMAKKISGEEETSTNVRGPRENIESHEAGLRKLKAEEEAARQRALERRKAKRNG